VQIAPSPVQREPVTPGKLLGARYRLLRKLGEGGMGEAWEAEHVVIRKRVVVKLLTKDIGPNSERGERLLREAQAAAHIHHPNIVDITDFGTTPEGQPFIVMELLDGRTLEEIGRRDGALPWARVRPILGQLADALQTAHAKGVIHRDLKPENVFLIERGPERDFVKIIDFGIAKLTHVAEAESFTRTGMVYGTPAYMSPEQGRGERIDARTDVYALGCIAYFMLTGQGAFQGGTVTEVLFKQLFEEAPPMRERAPHAIVPAAVEAFVRKAMRKDRELRFQTMYEVRSVLTDIDRGAPPVFVPQEALPRSIEASAASFSRPASAVHPSPASAFASVPAQANATAARSLAASVDAGSPRTLGLTIGIAAGAAGIAAALVVAGWMVLRNRPDVLARFMPGLVGEVAVEESESGEAAAADASAVAPATAEPEPAVAPEPDPPAPVPAAEEPAVAATPAGTESSPAEIPADSSVEAIDSVDANAKKKKRKKAESEPADVMPESDPEASEPASQPDPPTEPEAPEEPSEKKKKKAGDPDLRDPWEAEG
jgi:serine/threonine-protein kinase